MGSRGLMDRALDLKPEVTQSCGFESRLRQEVSTTEVRPLSKAPNPQLLPGHRNVGCPLLHLDGLNAEHISLFIILCIIVYVTNKAHLSLICIVLISFNQFRYYCSFLQICTISELIYCLFLRVYTVSKLIYCSC